MKTEEKSINDYKEIDPEIEKLLDKVLISLTKQIDGLTKLKHRIKSDANNRNNNQKYRKLS